VKRSELKTADPKAQLALLKQILLDDEQLKSMIFKSDSTLKTVKSIFQDDQDDNQSLISNLNNKVFSFTNFSNLFFHFNLVYLCYTESSQNGLHIGTERS